MSEEKKHYQFRAVAGFSRGSDIHLEMDINGMMLFRTKDCTTGKPCTVLISTDFEDLQKLLSVYQSIVHDALVVHQKLTEVPEGVVKH